MATPGVYSSIPPGGRNRVAIVALSLSVAALLSAAVFRVVLSSHASELEEMGVLGTSYRSTEDALMLVKKARETIRNETKAVL